MNDREKFLEERRGCLGGSDAGDLLDLPPFGCSRKLWFDKKGVPEDFPFHETFHIRRGVALEALAAEEFCREFNATVDATVLGHAVDQLRTYLGVHVDRIILAPSLGEGKGVLECKVPSVWAFRKIKQQSSPPLSWVAQVQWALMVTGCKWGAIGVFNPDAFSVLKFDVAPDIDMQQQLRDIAEVFWESLVLDENPQDKLPDGDSRCWECRWRTKCKGIGLNENSPTSDEKLALYLHEFERDDSPKLVQLVKFWEEGKADLNEAKKYTDALKAEILDVMRGRNLVMADNRKVVLKKTRVKEYTVKAGERVSLEVLE